MRSTCVQRPKIAPYPPVFRAFSRTCDGVREKIACPRPNSSPGWVRIGAERGCVFHGHRGEDYDRICFLAIICHGNSDRRKSAGRPPPPVLSASRVAFVLLGDQKADRLGPPLHVAAAKLAKRARACAAGTATLRPKAESVKKRAKRSVLFGFHHLGPHSPWSGNARSMPGSGTARQLGRSEAATSQRSGLTSDTSPITPRSRPSRAREIGDRRRKRDRQNPLASSPRSTVRGPPSGCRTGHRFRHWGRR